MSFVYTAGLNNMGSYQVSGRPWLKSSDILTGEEQQLEFPKVTKSIKIKKIESQLIFRYELLVCILFKIISVWQKKAVTKSVGYGF